MTKLLWQIFSLRFDGNNWFILEWVWMKLNIILCGNHSRVCYSWLILNNFVHSMVFHTYIHVTFVILLFLISRPIFCFQPFPAISGHFRLFPVSIIVILKSIIRIILVTCMALINLHAEQLWNFWKFLKKLKRPKFLKNHTMKRNEKFWKIFAD